MYFKEYFNFIEWIIFLESQGIILPSKSMEF